MYRQFPVRLEDRKYQKILWRNADGETETYHRNTVTFGLSAAPYLAIRCLKRLEEDEGHRFLRAAQVLQQDFYVDDTLTGAETKDEAFKLPTELAELLKLAGLNILKWASNDRELLHGLSEEKTNHKQLLTYETSHQFRDRKNLRPTRIARAGDRSGKHAAPTNIGTKGRLG
jgi:hypothetical protein